MASGLTEIVTYLQFAQWFHPSLFDDDRDMIEDLVAAAFNDAQRKAEAAAQEKMSAVTAGMSLPAGMKLPF